MKVVTRNVGVVAMSVIGFCVALTCRAGTPQKWDDLPKAVSRAAGQYRRHAVTYPPAGPHVPRPRLFGPVAPGGYPPPDKAEDLDDREP